MMNALTDVVTPQTSEMTEVMTGYAHFIDPSQTFRIVRKGPSVIYEQVGQLTAKDQIYYYPNTSHDHGVWVYVKSVDGSIEGWASFYPTILLFLQLPVKPVNVTPVILNFQLSVEVADEYLDDLLKQNVLISYSKLDKP